MVLLPAASCETILFLTDTFLAPTTHTHTHTQDQLPLNVFFKHFLANSNDGVFVPYLYITQLVHHFGNTPIPPHFEDQDKFALHSTYSSRTFHSLTPRTDLLLMNSSKLLHRISLPISQLLLSTNLQSHLPRHRLVLKLRIQCKRCHGSK